MRATEMKKTWQCDKCFSYLSKDKEAITTADNNHTDTITSKENGNQNDRLESLPIFTSSTENHSISKEVECSPNHRTDSSKYYCDVCNKNFASARNLRRHRSSLFHEIMSNSNSVVKSGQENMSTSQSKVNPPKHYCDLCNISFSTRGTLLTHKKSSSHLIKLRSKAVERNKNKQQNIKKQNGIGTNQNSNLFKHSNASRRTCNDCNFVFASRSNLRRHLRSPTHLKRCLKSSLNHLNKSDRDTTKTSDIKNYTSEKQIQFDNTPSTNEQSVVSEKPSKENQNKQFKNNDENLSNGLNTSTVSLEYHSLDKESLSDSLISENDMCIENKHPRNRKSKCVDQPIDKSIITSPNNKSIFPSPNNKSIITSTKIDTLKNCSTSEVETSDNSGKQNKQSSRKKLPQVSLKSPSHRRKSSDSISKHLRSTSKVLLVARNARERSNFHENMLGCDVCTRKFRYKWSLDKHRRLLHHSSSCFQVPCPICHQYFETNSAMERHHRRYHDKSPQIPKTVSKKSEIVLNNHLPHLPLKRLKKVSTPSANTSHKKITKRLKKVATSSAITSHMQFNQKNDRACRERKNISFSVKAQSNFSKNNNDKDANIDEDANVDEDANIGKNGINAEENDSHDKSDVVDKEIRTLFTDAEKTSLKSNLPQYQKSSPVIDGNRKENLFVNSVASNNTLCIAKSSQVETISNKKIMSHTSENSEEKVGASESVEAIGTNGAKIGTSIVQSSCDIVPTKKLHSISYLNCHVCSRTFSKRVDLAIHLIEHTDSKQFSCYRCEGKFSSKRGFLIHFARIHSKNKKKMKDLTKKIYKISCYSFMKKHAFVSCSSCSQIFLSNKHLKSHGCQSNHNSAIKISPTETNSMKGDQAIEKENFEENLSENIDSLVDDEHAVKQTADKGIMKQFTCSKCKQVLASRNISNNKNENLCENCRSAATISSPNFYQNKNENLLHFKFDSALPIVVDKNDHVCEHCHQTFKRESKLLFHYKYCLSQIVNNASPQKKKQPKNIVKPKYCHTEANIKSRNCLSPIDLRDENEIDLVIDKERCSSPKCIRVRVIKSTADEIEEIEKTENNFNFPVFSDMSYKYEDMKDVESFKRKLNKKRFWYGNESASKKRRFDDCSVSHYIKKPNLDEIKQEVMFDDVAHNSSFEDLYGCGSFFKELNITIDNSMHVHTESSSKLFDLNEDNMNEGLLTTKEPTVDYFTNPFINDYTTFNELPSDLLSVNPMKLLNETSDIFPRNAFDFMNSDYV